MNIKQLLSNDIKNASARIWKDAKTEIPPSEANELAQLALEKSKVYRKLREIEKIIPEINKLLELHFHTDLEDEAHDVMLKLTLWERN